MHDNPTAQAPSQVASSKPYRVKEVASTLGVDISTVYAAIHEGQLVAYRVGSGRGTFRVPRSALAEYAAKRGIPSELLEVAS
ncbi:helix-turn-helix domain-containing protein [Streptomyces yunnanensis]|uniref:DNA binding domain-containing protein, excisionase family n=1 Tax=Streptomyces yunnanensis TaxID=156453 RepID=A0A9X8QS99_9ACTN|nr:helix-turn-helix domain-containing protein [Streptomyces yunnanensis]SHL74497.1 DNA binding domain-containing protein, excisionase family [Streptomyces yunnanensis]